MDTKSTTNPAQLERYSFLWSQIRLIIAALALFLGGIPPIYFLLRVPGLHGITSALLTICWIISGLTSAYLLYRWNGQGKRLFGGKDRIDTAAFFISVVSGINLGFVGLIGTNIGMSISSNRTIFVIVGLLYLAAAYQLWQRWQASGQKIF